MLKHLQSKCTLLSNDYVAQRLEPLRGNAAASGLKPLVDGPPRQRIPHLLRFCNQLLLGLLLQPLTTYQQIISRQLACKRHPPFDARRNTRSRRTSA